MSAAKKNTLAAKTARDSFTASELCLAARIPRSRFFAHRPKAKRVTSRWYGKVAAFAVEKLPENLRDLLDRARRREDYASVEEFVRARLQLRRRENVVSLLRQRLAPRSRAIELRDVLAVYFQALDNGKSESESTRLARADFVRRTGANISERQIRRIAVKVDAAGGPDLAPLDAYAPAKSVSHKRADGGQHHGAAATAAARCGGGKTWQEHAR